MVSSKIRQIVRFHYVIVKVLFYQENIFLFAVSVDMAEMLEMEGPDVVFGAERLELPVNDDNTVPLEVLHQLDDKATGLKYWFVS